MLHDATLERTTDGQGSVRDLSLAALRRLDAGFHFAALDGSHPARGQGIRVPTLEELLVVCPQVPLNIEIKQETPAIEDAVLAVLDRHGARANTLLAAEEATIMERIRHAAPDVLTSASAAEAAEFVFRVRDGRLDGYRPPFVALQVPPEYGGTAVVTPELVVAAHALSVEVHVWTINDPVEMERLLDLGVDALMTDFPSRARDVYRRRGLRASA